MTGGAVPNFSLAGKRAIITGAGRGIGRDIAAALCAFGAHGTLVARTADEIEEGAAAIRSAGGLAETAFLDITDIALVRDFFASHPPFDILVNNAGTNRPKPIAEVSDADFDAVIGLNLKAAYFVAQAWAGRLIATGRPGSLIHISSQMGHVGAIDRTLYCASKWAIEGLNKALAVELAPHGIRSNSIAPTFIETPMTRPFLAEPDFRASVIGKIKLGRLGTPADLTGAAVLLASDASGLMTGSSLVIDGGWTAE